jgi:hypothetical protein
MATLEKLLGTRSFNNMAGHLVYCKVILLAFSRGLALPLVVQLVAPTFLGCRALIIPTLVIHFQLDDHFILFDAVAHVEINIFPF